MTSRSSFKIWLCILGVVLFLGLGGWIGLRELAISDAVSYMSNERIKRGKIVDVDFNTKSLLEFEIEFLNEKDDGKILINVTWSLTPWRKCRFTHGANFSGKSQF